MKCSHLSSSTQNIFHIKLRHLLFFKLIDLIKDEDEANVLPEEDQSDVELTDVESESNGKSNAGGKHKALDSSSDSEEEIDEDVIGETDEEAMAVDT